MKPEQRIKDLLEENERLKAQIAEIREVEEALASERDKLQALVDGLARTEIGIIIIGNNHKVHFQNQLLEERFGPLLQEPCYAKYMKREEPCDDCPMTLALEHNRLETSELVAADNRDCRVLSAPFLNPDGTIDKVVEVVLDITERKKTEAMLKESEQLFRSIVENSHGGIFTVDDAFRFTHMNDKLCEILGYPHEEILGHDFREFLDEESRQLVAERYVKRQRGESVPSAYDFNIVRKNGAIRRVELSSTVVLDLTNKPRTVGQILDITERKKAEEELQKAHAELENRVNQRTAQLSEANELLQQEVAQRRQIEERLRENETKYRELVENANSIILEMDTAGKVTFFNKFAQEFFGYSENEILGRNVVGTIVPETDSAGTDLKAKITDVVRHPERYHGSENENMRKSGERAWVAWTNRGVYSDAGELAQILCIGIDRTEQKRAAEVLAEQSKEKAAAAERQRLARDLHDAVTQTLFSASLIAEVLPRLWAKDKDEGNRRLDELRQLTRGALAEMRTLLLELRPAALTEVGLPDLLRQLSEAAAGRARLPVTLNVQGQCALLPDVQVALYRVAQEALNNVIKHSGASQAAVSLVCQPDSTELYVSDNGCGFDPGKASPDHLGLAIMRERTEAINAKLVIESRVGQGTLVKVICPDQAKGEQ